MDQLTKEKRSWNMGRVRNKDTKPEMIVRKLIHNHGFRYRLHKKDLPGKPDIVLAKHTTVIFVHGCFWHRHNDCPDATLPKTRTDFWSQKFDGNIRRDKNNQLALRRLGWNVIIIWECETKKPSELLKRLIEKIYIKKQRHK